MHRQLSRSWKVYASIGERFLLVNLQFLALSFIIQEKWPHSCKNMQEWPTNIARMPQALLQDLLKLARISIQVLAVRFYKILNEFIYVCISLFKILNVYV